MKKLIALLAAFAMLICMCACQNKQTNTDKPTEVTQATTQPTEEQPTTEPTEPEKTEAELMQELLATMNNGICMNYALASLYETPADADLYYIFYGGFEDEDKVPTEEELALLESAGKFWPEMDLIRLPVEKMDAALTALFGITLEQTNGVGLDKMIYLEQTNSYYLAHTDTNNVQITVQSVQTQDDGTVLVSYNEAVNGDCVVTLQSVEDGGYYILSNLQA